MQYNSYHSFITPGKKKIIKLLHSETNVYITTIHVVSSIVSYWYTYIGMMEKYQYCVIISGLIQVWPSGSGKQGFRSKPRIFGIRGFQVVDLRTPGNRVN